MSADLVPLADPVSAELMADPAQYVVDACERAKAWLVNALEHRDIDQIVELKSQAEAIRVYTRQKELGKDAELSAAEIVRRAERGIGVAIRKGQAAEEIAALGAHQGPGRDYTRVVNGKEQTVRVRRDGTPDRKSISPTTFFKGGSDMAATYAVTDGVTDELFDDAIAAAKAEGNLSRANVVRKTRAKRDAQEAKQEALANPESDDDGEWVPASSEKSPKAKARRLELIRELGAGSWTSQQIAERIGISVEHVRLLARGNGIEIAADAVFGKSQQWIDSNRIMRETVNGLDGLEMALDLVDYADLDRSEIGNWTVSLTKSIRVLNRLNKRLKEMVQ